MPGRLSLISQVGGRRRRRQARLRAHGPDRVCAGRPAGSAVTDARFRELLEVRLWPRSRRPTAAPGLYLETLRDARKLSPAARGRAKHQARGRASGAGRHEVPAERDSVRPLMTRRTDTALKRAGTVRVHLYAQLFAAARMLAVGRIPRGNRLLAIVTNGRGPGLLCRATAQPTNGVQLQPLNSSATTPGQPARALLPATT